MIFLIIGLVLTGYVLNVLAISFIKRDLELGKFFKILLVMFIFIPFGAFIILLIIIILLLLIEIIKFIKSLFDWIKE